MDVVLRYLCVCFILVEYFITIPSVFSNIFYVVENTAQRETILAHEQRSGCNGLPRIDF